MAAYWGIAAHSAHYMFSWYKYLSVILVFFPFPDHCLFVPFSLAHKAQHSCLRYGALHQQGTYTAARAEMLKYAC